jgi:uncharacterized protein YigA (DUF484 family)
MTSWEVRRLAERLGLPEPSPTAVALVRAAVAAERERAHKIAMRYSEASAIASAIALRISDHK